MSNGSETGPLLTRRDMIGRIGLLTGGIVLSGCSTSSSSTPQGASSPRAGGTIQVAFSDAYAQAQRDPAMVLNTYSNVYALLAWDTLMVTDENWNLQPSLATEWTVSEDAHTWTLKLRNDVRFHNGQKMTSRDVAFSLKRVLDPTLGASAHSRLSRSLTPQGITTPSPTTVRLELNKPDSFLGISLTSTGVGIVPEGFTEALGSGPYRFEQWDQGASFVLARNEDFWGNEPYLDAIRGVVIRNMISKQQSVLTGTSDLCDPIDLATAAAVPKSDSVEVVEIPTDVHLSIVMDSTIRPFDHPSVVKALKLATDREKINRLAYAGRGAITLDIPEPPNSVYYPDGLEYTGPDVDEAQRLLAEAGYPDGVDITLQTTDSFPAGVDLATVFAEAVKPAGIRVNVVQAPASTYFEQVWLNKPMYVNTWSRRHPYDLLSTVYRSGAEWNGSRFANSKLDRLLDEAAATIDPDKQRELITDALTIVSDEASTVIPAFMPRLWLKSKQLMNFDVSVPMKISLREAYLA